MRGALNIPTVHDPEVLNKLDHQSIASLCQRYQDHLKLCSEVVSTEQNALTQRIREVRIKILVLDILLFCCILIYCGFYLLAFIF